MELENSEFMFDRKYKKKSMENDLSENWKDVSTVNSSFYKDSSSRMLCSCSLKSYQHFFFLHTRKEVKENKITKPWIINSKALFFRIRILSDYSLFFFFIFLYFLFQVV